MRQIATKQIPESDAGSLPWPRMERLAFQLPDFTRISWASDAAREVWGARLSQITLAWLDIEWRAVTSGVRRCALTSVTPEDLVIKGAEWAGKGLNALPLEIQGQDGKSYSSTKVEPTLGTPFLYRVVIGTANDVVKFKAAMDDGDDSVIGELLGFPECCTAFFRDVWVDQAMVDTTWPMAANGPSHVDGENVLEIPAGTPAHANILWRWMGVRAVPHLPCRFDCDATVKFGEALLQVGRDSGYDQEMDWLLEILDWPVEWSALHGIAEVKTPLLKVSTRTDATANKIIVRKQGGSYPGEGATGLHFPFTPPVKRKVTVSPGFTKGIKNPIEPMQPMPAWYASDNGFNTIDGMDRAHLPIVAAVVGAMRESNGDIIDLGCGNGALLGKISRRLPRIIPHGIELDAEKVAHARQLYPEFAEHIRQSDMFDDIDAGNGSNRYALALLMPGRLLEVSPDRVERLRQWLINHCAKLLVYAYGDWLTKYGDLSGLAEQAGIALEQCDATATAGFGRIGP